MSKVNLVSVLAELSSHISSSIAKPQNHNLLALERLRPLEGDGVLGMTLKLLHAGNLGGHGHLVGSHAEDDLVKVLPVVVLGGWRALLGDLQAPLVELGLPAGSADRGAQAGFFVEAEVVGVGEEVFLHVGGGSKLGGIWEVSVYCI